MRSLMASLKVLNLMWGFNLGGIGKCFLTYAGLGEIEPRLNVHTACINLQNVPFDLAPLREIGATLLEIRSRRDLSWFSQCRELIMREQPDAVFTHGFNGPVVVQALRKRYGLAIPMLCSYHSEYHPPCFSRRFVAPVFNYAAHSLYRRAADGIVTVAETNREFLVRCGVDRSKIAVVHNGIATRPLARRRLGGLAPEFAATEDGLTVGIASRLDPVKGLGYLLEAVARVRKTGRKLRLLLLGDGPLRGPLQAQAQTLGIGHAVYFAGFQSNIPDWLDALDVFALPSLSEAHSISLLEAMRAGIAIVATNVGGNPESVRDGREALLVPAANVPALTEALVRMTDDAGLRTRLGNAARSRFESEFTEEIMKRRLADWLLHFTPSPT